MRQCRMQYSLSHVGEASEMLILPSTLKYTCTNYNKINSYAVWHALMVSDVILRHDHGLLTWPCAWLCIVCLCMGSHAPRCHLLHRVVPQYLDNGMCWKWHWKVAASQREPSNRSCIAMKIRNWLLLKRSYSHNNQELTPKESGITLLLCR